MDTSTLKNEFFQALHCPKGANSYFALGLLGSGGFGMETDYIPRQNIFIGVSKFDKIKCLPFFSSGNNDWLKDYMVGGVESASGIELYSPSEIKRSYNTASDVFETPDFSFTISSLTDGIANPQNDFYSNIKFDVAPFIAICFTIDNSSGNESIDAFFATDGVRGIEDISDFTNGEYSGFTEKKGYAIAAKCCQGAKTIQNNSMEDIFIQKKENFKLSRTAGIKFNVPAGKKETYDIIVAFYNNGGATRGQIQADYLYKKYFTDIYSVIDYGFKVIQKVWNKVENINNDPEIGKLNVYEQFMLNHARHGYFASTMLFFDGTKCRYVVNEGTFMMMNTLDLAVDHLMYEIPEMPWVVKNQLDCLIDEYSYYDNVKSLDNKTKYQGGISFAHDQGVNGYFTPHGTSSYEIPDCTGCFSYMTAEQLCNFIISAGAYIRKTNDIEWLRRRRSVIEDCLTSLINRDNPSGKLRNGIMAFDSDKCRKGSEITTYDSLDESLGQARNNIYIASKFFASYVILQHLFEIMNNSNFSLIAAKQAKLCEKTICSGFDSTLGYIPAILSENNNTAIIPAVEGLAYIHLCGLTTSLERYTDLIDVYKKHISKVLCKDLCLFEDNGWKLSSNNDNSWMSKIFVNKFVVKSILGMDISNCDLSSDIAHAQWWADSCRESPCVDQIFAGKTNTSGFHYPRGVTAELWIRKY